MNRLGILLLLSTLLAGCATDAPMQAPTPIPAPPTVASMPPSPSPPPTQPPPAAAPTAVATAVPTATPTPIDHSDVRCETADSADGISPSIMEIIDHLEFALRPTALPDGFALAGVSSGSGEAKLSYQNEDKYINIVYPVSFSPKEANDSLGWKRPNDAVSELRLGDRTAHLMTGGWSDDSVLVGPALNPKEAEWDYDKSLTLFFTCRADEGQHISVAIQAIKALPRSIDWIDTGKIVMIAQSLKQIPPP